LTEPYREAPSRVLFEPLTCPGRKVELRLELSPVSVRWSLGALAVSEELDPPRKLDRYFTGEELRNDFVFSALFETLNPRRILVLKDTSAGVKPGFATSNCVLRNWMTVIMLVVVLNMMCAISSLTSPGERG
jgi:hypothetical protein